MNKIDKIIQILHKGDGEILGLSESGRMYKYRPPLAGGSLRYDACWELEIESPVVDNSAVEVDEQKQLTAQRQREIREDMEAIALNLPSRHEYMDDWTRQVHGFPPKETK